MAAPVGKERVQYPFFKRMQWHDPSFLTDESFFERVDIQVKTLHFRMIKNNMTH